MNIKSIIKREKVVVPRNYTRAAFSWMCVILLTLGFLLVSIVFNILFFFAIEGSINAAPAPVAAAASETIDRTGLSASLADRATRIADLPSAKAAALLSVDPSR
jgi:hypothetical protein